MSTWSLFKIFLATFFWQNNRWIYTTLAYRNANVVACAGVWYNELCFIMHKSDIKICEKFGLFFGLSISRRSLTCNRIIAMSTGSRFRDSTITIKVITMQILWPSLLLWKVCDPVTKEFRNHFDGKLNIHHVVSRFTKSATLYRVKISLDSRRCPFL